MNSLSIVKGMKVMLLSGIAAGAICALSGPGLADDNRRDVITAIMPPVMLVRFSKEELAYLRVTKLIPSAE